MCFPNLTASLMTGSLGVGIQSAAAYQQAQLQQQAAEFNATQYEQNAALYDIRAGKSRELGGIEYEETLKEYNTLRGEQRVAYGASGVNVNTGSAADMQAETAAQGVYEAQKARYNRDLEAWEHTVSATNLRSQATITRATASSSSTLGGLSAASAGLSGLSSLYRLYGSWGG